MTAEFDIVEKQGILHICITGEPTPEDLVNILQKIQKNSQYTHRLRLWDFQNSTFHLAKEDLEKVAAQAATADGVPGKVALLVEEDLSFGVGRMYEAYRSSAATEVEVFREESDAIAWLLEKPA